MDVVVDEGGMGEATCMHGHGAPRILTSQRLPGLPSHQSSSWMDGSWMDGVVGQNGWIDQNFH